MANAGANEQGVLCVRFVATRDDGQAAHARADVPELVLAAKHAPGCAAAFELLRNIHGPGGMWWGEGFAHVRIWPLEWW